MLSSETPVRRRYTEKERDGILMTVAASAGAVQPTAERLGVPHMTVADQWNHWMEEAHSLTDRSKDVSILANRFLAVALAAQQKLMELLPTEKSAYRAALMSGINLDKYLLLTGRPTSRTEIMKARYVEPQALRVLSARVIDVPLSKEGDGGGAVLADGTPQRGRGVGEDAGPSRVATGEKARSPRKRRTPRSSSV